MQEPSVLDYLKSRLRFGRQVPLPFPETPAAAPEMASVDEQQAYEEPELLPVSRPVKPRLRVPWQIFLALVLALIAQTTLEPPDANALVGASLYTLAFLALGWGAVSYQELVQPVPAETPGTISLQVRLIPFVLSPLVAILALVAFGGGVFNALNLTLWGLAIFYLFWSLWERPVMLSSWFARLRAWILRPEWTWRISRWTVALVLALLVLFAFRFYHLEQVPGEMFSDHAEKLLDVADVLDGKLNVFFPRNTGREAFQFYLTAAIARLFGTGLSFMSLKIGTALAGFFTLPFIFLLAKELGGRWVGLFALLLAGIAYWPNVISRVGLRFPLYPLFTAPALFFLIRGLRSQRRNDFLLAGLAIGIGLHGYSAARILPLVAVAAVLTYLLHSQSAGKRIPTLAATVLMGLVAFVVLIPLLRYALEFPQDVGYRMLTRLGGSERPLVAPVWQIFLNNLWTSLVMPFWKDGDIWVHSVTGRPALDVVSAALFFLGLIVVAVRYVRYRNWVDLFLLLAVPLLMLPSILSLAFPEENPSLNRSGGAIIPVFIIAAMGLVALLRVIVNRMGARWGRPVAALLALALFMASGAMNYDLVFNRYRQQFDLSSWNTSEIGRVVRGFADSVGGEDTAYVIPYPYWVDTRLVGINAGFPRKDFALQPADIPATLSDPRSKLFILNVNDMDNLNLLTGLYPDGALTLFQNALASDKDFIIYLVPGKTGDQP